MLGFGCCKYSYSTLDIAKLLEYDITSSSLEARLCTMHTPSTCKHTINGFHGLHDATSFEACTVVAQARCRFSSTTGCDLMLSLTCAVQDRDTVVMPCRSPSASGTVRLSILKVLQFSSQTLRSGTASCLHCTTHSDCWHTFIRCGASSIGYAAPLS